MPAHALLFANWSFEHPELVGGDLKYPENDIKELRTALSGRTLDDFVIETSLNRTAADLMEDLNTFIEKPKPDELLLVYFSGHGFPLDGHLCLAAKDTNRRNINKHVTCSAFVSALRNAKSRCILIILDCCYSGLAGRDLVETRGPRTLMEQCVQPLGFQDNAAEAASIALLYRDIEKEVRASTQATKGTFLLTATESLQIAEGNPDERLGVFTSHVIRALAGGALVRTPQTAKQEYGAITACSVFNYALER